MAAPLLMNPTVDISIIIVSFNVDALLRECLESILGDAADVDEATKQITLGSYVSEVIVVDSGSSDSTLIMLKSGFRWVHVIEAGSNVGFSKGNNLGIERSQGRLVLLLNPDTRVLRGSVARLAEFMDASPKVAVVGPQLLNQDGTTQSSRRRLPTLWTAFFESTWLQPFAPPRVLNRFYMSDTNEADITKVGWLTGAALLVRRSVIDEVGGLDEGFFMYSEELDWQRRIGMSGWEIVYLPAAQIVHYGGRSSDQFAAQRHLNFQNSKIRYFRKYHGNVAASALRAYLLLSYAFQLSLESLKCALNHKRSMRRQRIETYWQVIRSGLKGM